MLNTVPRIQVNKIVLAAPGILATGTITPAGEVAYVPNKLVAADIVSAGAWNFTDRAGGELFPVLAAEVRHFPGSFVRNMVLDAGTYKVCFYLDA